MTRRFRFLNLYAGIFLVFLYAPAILLPIFSFNDNTFAVFPLKGFTFKHLQHGSATCRHIAHFWLKAKLLYSSYRVSSAYQRKSTVCSCLCNKVSKFNSTVGKIFHFKNAQRAIP